MCSDCVVGHLEQILLAFWCGEEVLAYRSDPFHTKLNALRRHGGQHEALEPYPGRDLLFEHASQRQCYNINVIEATAA